MREGSVPAQRQALIGLGADGGETLVWRTRSHHLQSLDLSGAQTVCGGVEDGASGPVEVITTAKRKTDCLDARVLADLLRCDLFPACYVIAPEYEQLRQQLRFRALLVRTAVVFQNKTAGLLIENGVPYETARLHRKRYFNSLLQEGEGMIEPLRRLLGFNRNQLETLRRIDRGILAILLADPLLHDRVQQLRSIPGVGAITALTWALETGEPARFPNAKHAISYCGLCAAQRESAGVPKRGPFSRQRNSFLQTTLIEAEHLAPRYNETLRAVYQTELNKGPKNICASAHD